MRWFTVERLSARQALNPAGFLIVTDTVIARCGDQLYHHTEVPLEPDDNGLVRVARDASEVFRPESIASFEGVPLTDEHPDSEVTPENWRDLAVGYVANVRQGKGADSDCLVADLYISDPRVIDMVRSKKKLALSCGYDAYYEGITKGRGAQRKIVGNHVAIVSEGRCGTRCTIGDSGQAIFSHEGACCEACAIEDTEGAEPQRPGWHEDIDFRDAEFVEGEHPRDPAGKFTAGSGAGGGGPSGKSQSFNKGHPPPQELHGVELKSNPEMVPTDNAGWENRHLSHALVHGDFDEPALPKTTKKQGAGVIIREPDGRIWITHPTNQFGGYKATFPKGTVEEGMSTRGTALKEAFEESGLHVRLTGYAGDVERTTSTARYYHAVRVGGTPSDAGWESEAITLAHPDDLKHFLNHPVDQKMVDQYIAKAEAMHPPSTQSGGQEEHAMPLSDFKKVGSQLGSNPGGVYEHKNGGKYYVKLQKSNEHAKNELLASKLYNAAGAPTLNTQLIDMGGGKLGTATKWQEKTNINPNDPQHRKEAQEHFATHAWLANWDATGLGHHESDWNQAMVGGKMTTVDPGGSLLFRAQGGPKGGAFGDTVPEWDTLHHEVPGIPPNKMAHKIFGEMTGKQLRGPTSMRVAAVPDKLIRELVDKHGPGDDAGKKALADRIIARKRDIIKRALATHDAWHDNIDWPEAA